jgi:hypothetical protein
MVTMIALPWFASELAAALVAALAVLAVKVRRRPSLPFDAHREYAALETRIRTKANHPFTYPVRLWLRKGE